MGTCRTNRDQNNIIEVLAKKLRVSEVLPKINLETYIVNICPQILCGFLHL